MKTTIELLNRLTPVIDLDDFYAIRVEVGGISYQGRFTSDKAAKYNELFNLSIDNSGFVRGERVVNNKLISIVLT